MTSMMVIIQPVLKNDSNSQKCLKSAFLKPLRKNLENGFIDADLD